MSPDAPRAAGRSASLAGRYDLFLGLGGGLAILGLILFVRAARRPATADRAWQLFHVNWLYFTGLAAGSVAFVGGAEDHQRQVVGHDHPVRRGARSRSCRSRCSGCC